MAVFERFRSHLSYPIAATLVLVTVVPVALVGYLLATYNREHLTTLEKQVLTRQAVNLANEVSLTIAGHETRFQATGRVIEANPTVGAERLSQALTQTAADLGGAVVYLQIVDRSGQGPFARDPSLDDARWGTLEGIVRTAHAEALNGIPSRRFDAASGPLATVISHPLAADGEPPWGALTGVFDLGSVQERLEDGASGGFLVGLVDGSGRVIAASEEGAVGRDASESPLVEDFLRAPTPLRLTRTYTVERDDSSAEFLGSVAPVQGVEWAVVVERPAAEAFAPVRGMQLRTVLVSGAAALIALAVGFMLSRRLTIPIQELDRVSTELAEGNLTVRAAEDGHDELARLATNFNHMAGSVEALVRKLKHALRQNQELFLETIRTLAAAIDAKDPYTRGHSERVSSYSMAIAKHLGLDQDEVFRIRTAAILHDVGKLGIEDGILNKPAGLTEDEFTVMRRHPEIGAQIMAPIRMLREIIPGIRNHHETWDGQGYPDKLRGDEIPMVARIIGVADTFDAMTTTRPYQKAMSLDFVLGKMRAMSGNRFDPRVVDALLAAVHAGDVTPPTTTNRPSAPPLEVS
jgi:putative nucleotidyltransferase with HDIG domain